MGAKCNTFLLGSILTVSCVLGATGTPASAAVRGGARYSSQLSASAAAADLKALHAAEQYEPTSLRCAAQPAPNGVIAALEKTQVRGLHVLAKILGTCKRTASVEQALVSVGGIDNPEVLGLNAFGPIDRALQRGADVSTAEINAQVHAKDLAELLLAEKRAEDR